MRARTYPRQAIALLTQHPITHLSMTVSEWVLETLFLLPCLLKSNIFGPLTEKKKVILRHACLLEKQIK